MSPSGGSITVVLPLRTWSPEKSRASSTSTRQVWFAAWPGVCIARRRLRRETEDGRLIRAQRLQGPGAGRVVGVRMRADDQADVAAGRAPQVLDVLRVVRTGVDRDVSGVRVADEVAVGPGARHHPGIRGRAASQERDARD